MNKKALQVRQSLKKQIYFLIIMSDMLSIHENNLNLTLSLWYILKNSSISCGIIKSTIKRTIRCRLGNTMCLFFALNEEI